jgi:hypothetical protein
MSSNVFASDTQQGGYVNPPNLLKYSNVLPVGTPSSAKMQKMPPINGGTFKPTGTNVISIALQANAFLSGQESYLQFNIRNNGGNTIYPQSSAHSFFTRLRVLTGNAEIDRIDQYGALMAMLSDYQLSKEYRESVGAITQGYATCNISASAPMVGFHTQGTTPAVDRYAEDVDIVFNYDETTGIAPGDTRTFAIPIPCFLSLSKYIPLSRISGQLILELTLAPFRDAVTSNGAIDYELTNVNYHATLVTFNEGFESAFDAVLAQGQVQLHSPTYRNYNAPAGLGGYNVIIPDRARSIKSIFAIQRETAYINSVNNDQNRTDARAYDGMLAYQFRVGSSLFPAQEVDCLNGAESFTEMHKALGLSLAGTNHNGTIVNPSNYVAQSFVAGRTVNQGGAPIDGNDFDADPYSFVKSSRLIGKYAIGIDLESMTRASPMVESGMNTKDLSLPVHLNVRRAGAVDCRCDVWTLIDQVVTLTALGELIVSN